MRRDLAEDVTGHDLASFICDQGPVGIAIGGHEGVESLRRAHRYLLWSRELPLRYRRG